jgi:threonine dehydratase
MENQNNPPPKFIHRHDDDDDHEDANKDIVTMLANASMLPTMRRLAPILLFVPLWFTNDTCFFFVASFHLVPLKKRHPRHNLYGPSATIQRAKTAATASNDDSAVKTLDLPTYEDVVEASQILQGVAHPTPVLTSRTLNRQLGNDISVFFKCENLQRMGAFKFRGAYNALSHIPAQERQKQGVLTFSSGNHAQAIALSAQLLEIPATIIMPHDAPKLKVAATQEYGGKVIFYDRYTEDRDVIARDLQQKEGAILIPPYDQKYVIAGQGTAGKELLETLMNDQGKAEALVLDYLFVCVGGGGLISGCALAASSLAPNCRVIGVEPEAGNDAQQSLAKGEIVKIGTPPTIADGAQTQYIGQLTFEIMKENVHEIITVSDEELIDGMRFLGERMKMVVEPTGCLGLAGLRKMVSQGDIPAGAKCGVIISGGNVDLTRYCELLSQ